MQKYDEDRREDVELEVVRHVPGPSHALKRALSFDTNRVTNRIILLEEVVHVEQVGPPAVAAVVWLYGPPEGTLRDVREHGDFENHYDDVDWRQPISCRLNKNLQDPTGDKKDPKH